MSVSAQSQPRLAAENAQLASIVQFLSHYLEAQLSLCRSEVARYGLGLAVQ